MQTPPLLCIIRDFIELFLTSPLTTPLQPKNHLMNFPEGLPQTRMISSSSSSSSTQAASLKGDPKSISHAATRFNTDSNIVMAPPPPLHHQNNNSSFNSEFYKDMYSATPSLSHLKAQRGLVHLDPDNSSSTNRTGASTPNPYDFVPATPTLAPGVDVDPAELMTWGSIEGTPLLISGGGGETGGPRFSIAPTPKRDVIGHELSEKAAKSIRKRSEIAAGGGGGGGVSGGGRLGGRITTPRDLSLRSPYNPYHSTPRGTSSSSSSLNASTLMRSRMLSPAAQSLLQKTSSIKVSSSSSSSSSSHPFGSFSSSSSFSKSGAFTPRDSISTPPLVITTPRTKPSSSLSSSSISIPTNIKNNNTSSSSITDDLLKF